MTSFRDTNEALTPAKKRMRRRRMVIFWLLVGIILIALAGIIYLIFFSNIVKVKEISIQGNRIAEGNNLKQLLIKKLDERGAFARLLSSENILYWLNVHTISDSDIPAAGAVTVAASLIHRTVSINVKEREFSGVWCSDTCVGFDSNGIAFFLAPDVYGSLLLKIQDENANVLTLGSPVFGDTVALKNIFEVIEAVKNSGIVIDAVTIKDISLREWEIQNVQGTVFKFSLDFIPDDLTGIFENLKEKTNLKNLNYVDFRVRNRVYYK